MTAIIEQPLFSTSYKNINEFYPLNGSTYIFSQSSETRSMHFEIWKTHRTDILFVEIKNQSLRGFEAIVSGKVIQVSLRSSDSIKELLTSILNHTVYIDITGLEHCIWAPLLKYIIPLINSIQVLYVEPSDYNKSSIPTEDFIFDLSERIRGILPIPGFISLAEIDENDTCFVPLLGFEGVRFAYLSEQVQPYGNNVFPIIGVPGFKIEYPFQSFLGNKKPLLQYKNWRKVKYAPADCPYSVYYLLMNIKKESRCKKMIVAPIGTKPHALGAILYAIHNPNMVELIYDHPIRKAKRTEGMTKLHSYNISIFKFLS